MVFVSMLDLIGIASVLPFVTILSNPKLLDSNLVFLKLIEFLPISRYGDHVSVLGFLFFILILIGIISKSFSSYLHIRFSLFREYSLSSKLVETYLNQEYAWFLNKHSSELTRNVLTEINIIIGNAIQPILILISNFIIALGIFTALVFIDGIFALSLILFFGILSFFIYRFIGVKIRKLGELRFSENKKKHFILSELLTAIKEIKLTGVEHEFSRRFKNPALKYAELSVSAKWLAQLPKYLIELFSFGAIIFIILFKLKINNQDIESVIPVISFYAISAYRLMPSLQSIQDSISMIQYSRASVDAICKDFLDLRPREYSNLIYPKFNLNENLKLENVSFKYQSSSLPVLNNLTINIPANRVIGIVGPTGSGKSTIGDLILGLLSPNTGNLILGEFIINGNNLKSWQKFIGYVPQQITILDDSVASNIAFGTPRNEIDLDKVEKAAQLANIDDFIKSSLPNGYDTHVGERGVRLSGGQRQRIGIARALYYDPKILVMDEATSALDNITEKAVMDAIENLNRNITIIVIAHRVATIKICDYIYFIENGKITSQGELNDLFNNSLEFRNMFSGHGQI